MWCTEVRINPSSTSSRAQNPDDNPGDGDDVGGVVCIDRRNGGCRDCSWCGAGREEDGREGEGDCWNAGAEKGRSDVAGSCG